MPKMLKSKKKIKQTTSKFNTLGIDRIKQFITSFKPSFLAINLNGLKTLNILSTFSLLKLEDSS